MRPDISVVIPSYNRKESLLRLLSSLRAQTLVPERFEVIVSLDGSTDGSAEAIESGEWPFALTVVNGANGGPGASRNAGAAEATADLLVFLDDDVELDPWALDAHRDAAEKYGPAIILGHLRTSWLHHGPARNGELWRRFDSSPDGTHFTYKECYGGNLAVPRTEFERAGGFNPHLRRLEDGELAFRLARNGLAVIFSRKASGRQVSSKTAAGTLNDARLSGEAAMYLWHHAREFLVDSGGGMHRPRRRATANAAWLAAAVPLPGMAAAKLASIPFAFPGRRRLQGILWSRYYLVGARSRARNRADFVALLQRP